MKDIENNHTQLPNNNKSNNLSNSRFIFSLKKHRFQNKHMSKLSLLLKSSILNLLNHRNKDHIKCSLIHSRVNRMYSEILVPPKPKNKSFRRTLGSPQFVKLKSILTRLKKPNSKCNSKYHPKCCFHLLQIKHNSLYNRGKNKYLVILSL